MEWSGRGLEFTSVWTIYEPFFFRYDLPKKFQYGRKGKSIKKNCITVYPNCFHAVRDLVNFEYGSFPKTLKHKRIRLQKIQSLASGLQEAWSANKDTLTSGRVEISLFRFAADTDVLFLSKMIARSQLKKIQMIKVPVEDVIVSWRPCCSVADMLRTSAQSYPCSAYIALLVDSCSSWLDT